MGRYKIEELIESLKKYNDAVIVLGKDIVSKENKIFKVDEESKKIFNRKTLYKNPEIYWQFYFNCVYNEERTYTKEEKAVYKLISKINAVKIINDTTLDPYPEYAKKSFNLSGATNELTCVSERHLLCGENIAEKLKNTNFKCNICDSIYKPTILMYGEKYDPLMLQELNNIISREENGKRTPNTHNLIFIGADFDNDIIHDIAISFKALKESSETVDEKFFLTFILDHDPVNIERYEPDFSTTDDIEDSINRLINML